MKRLTVFILTIAFIALFCPGFSIAAERPVNLCLWDTVQLFPSTDSVRGLRLSLYGVNQNVTGIDLGIVPRVTGDFVGAQLGLVGIVENDFIGYQGTFVNLVYGNFTGLQTGFGNITDGHVSGIQWAVFNRAFSVKGVQLGLINITDWLQGVQLGLLNLNNTPNHPFPILPLVNWSF